MKRLLVKESNYKSKWVVFWLLVLMALVFAFGRLSKLLEITTVKADELTTIVTPLETENTKLKTELYKPLDVKIVEEIKRLFKDKAPQALKVVSCENASMKPERINFNSDGTFDSGPFQINSIHRARFGTKFIVDSIENVRVAYALFKEQGFAPWYSSNKCHHLV